MRKSRNAGAEDGSALNPATAFPEPEVKPAMASRSSVRAGKKQSRRSKAAGRRAGKRTK